MKTEVLSDLASRGLIAQCTDLDGLQSQVGESLALYAGFDPTAASLHVGSLIPLLTLRRFQLANHRPIALVGGATGLIGDPSFKANERRLNSTELVRHWTEKLNVQMQQFLDFDGSHAAIVVNNYDWLGSLGTLDFLRDVGKHFSVNAMVQRDAVKRRIERDNEGISFTEFAYGLLQAQDFVELCKRYDCLLQIGGSDQWGNIVGGVDLVRRSIKRKVFGLTQPLITRDDGTKFGKTEHGTIWLDAKLTSPYAFYQYWLRTADSDVTRHLLQFTFLSVSEIEEIVASHARRQDQRSAQRMLAEKITALVHGDSALNAAQRISERLFSGDVRDLIEVELLQLCSDGFTCIDAAAHENKLTDLLVKAGLAESNNRARELIGSGSIRVNGARVVDHTHAVTAMNVLYGKYVVLQRGKLRHALVAWTNAIQP